ncbi:MAG: endonuclease III [Clostridia bacterium]|nr:endonuclease III [Clostridia bacterium]MCI8979554.1 endonuclease III [Clostridia bacterium]MCI9085135.1 endonuclease III [Clostridia bacterium]
MTRKERVEKIRALLDAAYPDVKCSLNYSTPLEMLIATQLSAQCTDARVNIVTKPLFEKYKNVEDFASADYEELCEYIKSAGFYRNKAKNIILCCQRIIDVYGGEVPDTMEDLTSLAGTGRKTANLVLGDIFGKPAVVVDTHCKRIAKRIGLTTNDDPTKVEMDLKKIVPPDYQLRMCHQFVAHGRAVCIARNPKCGVCPIAEVCKSAGRC